MRLIYFVGTAIALGIAVAACASHPDATAIPATAQSASSHVRKSQPDKPLDYSLTVENKLNDTLSVSVTPGKNAVLTGASTFELKPGERETVRVTIPKYEPGTIATLNAQNAVNQQQMLNTISLAATNQGVVQIYSIDVASGLDEATLGTLNADLAAFTAIAKPDR
jgi:Killing trait